MAQYKWKVHQMDVKSTFLNGIKEEVYVEQSLGFDVLGLEKKVYKLKKISYELKKVPMAWYSDIYLYSLNNDFNKKW
jgi:hypothetical protein